MERGGIISISDEFEMKLYESSQALHLNFRAEIELEKYYS